MASMKKTDRVPRALSLFSGAMGLDLGLERAGIEVVGCVEFDAAAVRSIRYNRPDLQVLQEDISSVDALECLRTLGVDEVDVIVGGPPCQAFSVFGKRLGVGDPRGRMIYEYLRFVRDIRPHAFVLENVRGLLSMRLEPNASKGSLFSKLVADFLELGYRVDTFVVNAVNYGAPQIRERLIIVGNRIGQRAVFPKPTHSDKPSDGLALFRTLGDALNGQTDPDPTIMDFSPRKKNYLKMVPPGGNWRSLPLEVQLESMGKTFYLKGGRSAYWRRLSFDAPCPTVVTMPNHAGTSMCHPAAMRALTVGECALIQGFPADWHFNGSPMERYRQVGNAVPVVLGEMVGKTLISLLSGLIPDAEIAQTITHIRPHVRTRQYFKQGKVYVQTPYGGEPQVSESQLEIVL